MGKDVVDALRLQMTESELFDWTVEQTGDVLTAAVSALAAKVFGAAVRARATGVIWGFLLSVVATLSEH